MGKKTAHQRPSLIPGSHIPTPIVDGEEIVRRWGRRRIINPPIRFRALLFQLRSAMVIIVGALAGCNDAITPKITGIKKFQLRRLLLIMVYCLFAMGKKTAHQCPSLIPSFISTPTPTTCSIDSDNRGSMTVEDFSGGSNGFELALRFCYSNGRLPASKDNLR